MAIYYKLYQYKGTDESRNGKWYGRLAYTGTDSVEELASAIQEKCTVHRADIMAVLTALTGEIDRALKEGRRVRIPGLGTFKVGISTRPADTRDEFTVAHNVNGLRVIFTPELHVNRTSKTTTRSLLQGAVVKEMSAYDDGTLADSAAKSGGASTGGSSSTGGGSSTTTGGGETSQGGTSSGGSGSEEEGGEHS